MSGRAAARYYLTLICCLLLSACGKGQGSQVDTNKGQITQAQITERSQTELQKAAQDLGVSAPTPPDASLSIEAGPDIFSDANLLVNLQGDPQERAASNGIFARTLWSQIDTGGPEVPILNPEQLNTQVLVPDVSQYTRLSFRLTGVTQDNQVASDTLDLFVYPLANSAKVVGSSQRENATQVNFTVRLNKPANQTTELTYRTADGTAVAGVDYIAQAASLTFAPGEQEKTVAVQLLSDTTREKGEYFTLQVSGQEGDKPFSARGVAVIRDSDPLPPIVTRKPTQTAVDRDQSELAGLRGQVRVNLVWSDPLSGVELFVKDPCENWLSLDLFNASCEQALGEFEEPLLLERQRNIVWRSYAPQGRYQVRLRHANGIGSSYTARVYWGDKAAQLEGVIGGGETVDVFSFEVTDLEAGEPSTSSSSGSVLF